MEEHLPACACVQRWAGAKEYVAGPAARWGALLLAWEMTGGAATRRDVEEAAREMLAAWRAAAGAYERIDGSHPYRPHVR